ncbi:MAG: DUF255 domain-containing protein [Lysobacteraceae bacterium]
MPRKPRGGTAVRTATGNHTGCARLDTARRHRPRRAWAASRLHDYLKKAQAGVGASSGAVPLNALIHASSPYLLQHAFNPVDWQSVDDTTANDQRPRLISIGYSTCYWCHRMAEEAFSDPAIGKLLNTRFHAIKIDREQHPELDARYTRLQRLSSGEVGWPVTVIENAKGEPLFVGAYLGRDELLVLLQRITRLQDRAPAALAAMAAGFRALQPATPPSDASASPTLPIDDIDALITDHWDSEHGGLRGEQKFPDAALMDWLLARGIRDDSHAASAALRQQLDAMLASPLFDPVNGGFFRYSTRSDWSHPHYEKMLYNQAQLLRLYARAAQHWDRPAWQTAAASIARFAEDWLRQPDDLYASAVDARYEGREGGYYLLKPAEADRLATDRDWLQADRVDDLAQLRLTHASLNDAQLDANLRALSQTRVETTPRPFIDSKTITSWNALYASALLTWSDSNDGNAARTRAAEILDRLWRRFDAESGRLDRDQHGEVAGSLDDYAQLAQALLDLDARQPDETLRQRSAMLLRAAADRYLTPSAANPELARDGELQAPLATLCLALQAQSRRSTREDWQPLLNRCLSTSQRGAQENSGANWSTQRAVLTAKSGDTDVIAFFADGAGRAWLDTSIAGESRLHIELQDGWHINAHVLDDKRLLATTVSAEDDAGNALTARYPDGIARRLEILGATLQLYEGRTDIRIDGDAARATLKLQACSDRVCLLPETLMMYR